FFVHIGMGEEMKIGGRTKLYGTEVIRIHRMLKSVPNKADYLLVTEAACESLGMHQVCGEKSQAEFPHIGAVEYLVFDGAFIMAASEERSVVREVFEVLTELAQGFMLEFGRQYRRYLTFPYSY